MIDSQEMDLLYKYSSEDDSDEENQNPLSKRGRGSFNRSPNTGSTGTYIQKRGSGKGSNSYRGSRSNILVNLLEMNCVYVTLIHCANKLLIRYSHEELINDTALCSEEVQTRAEWWSNK